LRNLKDTIKDKSKDENKLYGNINTIKNIVLENIKTLIDNTDLKTLEEFNCNLDDIKIINKNKVYNGLTYACSKNKKEIIDMLIKKGASIKTKNLLEAAATKDNAELVEYLLTKHKVDLSEHVILFISKITLHNYLKVLKYITPKLNRQLKSVALLGATRYNKIDMVEHLINNGAVVNVFDNQALIVAINNENLKIVELLVNAGVDVNIPNNKPILTAIEEGSIEIILYLLDHGATKENLLETALKSKQLETVCYMLKNRIVEFNLTPKLFYNIIETNDELFIQEIIIEYNIDIHNYPDVLVNATSYRVLNIPLIHYLLDLNVDVTYQDSQVLINILYFGNLDLVKLLIEKGADPRTQNNMPLNIAQKFGFKSIVDYLISQGAYL
jgi:ankyrin repeat protein